MAVYRSIHVSFWQDEFILDLEPDEKYFYLYLMTNSKTTQCGIYELPKKLMVLELGYPMDTLSILLKKFVAMKKILYSEETREIFVLNWLKHNSIKSPKVLACVEKELKAIKDKAFIGIFAKQCIEYGYPIPTVCQEYIKRSKPSQHPYGEEEEKEEEKEEEQEQEEKPVVVVNPFNFYENNFSTLNSFVSQNIGIWIDDTNEEIVLEAMKTAISNNAKNWKYIDTVLKNWFDNNLKTIEDVQAYNKEYEDKKKKRTGKTNVIDWDNV